MDTISHLDANPVDPHSDSQVSLSLVVPAYNEATRLPVFLEDVRRYFVDGLGPDYEVIVVDDGSTDATGEFLEELSCCWPQLVPLRHDENRGKGAAVRTGIRAASGRLLLFSDADGATPISEERKLRRLIEEGADIAVGTRVVGGAEVKRNWSRGLAGHLFARSARWFTGVPVSDPQCGFKMFRREIGRALFDLCDETGYLFDLQILSLALHYELRVRECSVNWHEVAGSKVSLIGDGWKMWCGLRNIRRRVRQIVMDSPGLICRNDETDSPHAFSRGSSLT